jgi:protein SCO1/2
MNKLRGIIILSLLLVLPILWVFLWKSGDYKYEKLPLYGDIELTGDTVPFVISDFSFIDQSGDSITSENFNGKIYLANFIFTTCPDICPKVTNNLMVVYDKFKDNPFIEFISHTVHPEHDSVPVLAAWAKKMGIDNDRWHFVTGKKSDLYRIAQEDYRVTATKGRGPKDFIHSEMIVLIDKEKHIRGYYQGQDFKEIRRLIDGVRVLLKEYCDKGKRSEK